MQSSLLMLPALLLCCVQPEGLHTIVAWTAIPSCAAVPLQVNDPTNPTKKIDDYWGPSQALLGDSTFMSQLQEYDKDHIPPACIVAVRPYLDRPEFAAETVKKASKAAYGLCCWVRAMEAYDK